jgi:hypothetical protein
MKLEALEAFVCTDVACGDGFFILILSDGRQISWGRNEMGQLGLGDRESRERPKRASILSSIPGELGFIQIAAGNQHCIGISVRGNVFTWGGNRRGQLGDGFLNSCPSPTLVPQLKHRPVVSVCCGENHCLAMTVGGNLYAWGDNTQGQLGLGDTTMRLRPEIVKSLKIAKASTISAGKTHSLVSTQNGLLFAFGGNFYGQLGLGADAEKIVTAPSIVEKMRGKQVVEVSCGDTHTLIVVLSEEGENQCVYVTGQASVGQLGLGAGSTSPVFSPVKLDLSQIDGAVMSASCGGPSSLLSFLITEGVPFKRVSLPSIDLPSLKKATDKLRQQKEAIQAAEHLGSDNAKHLASLYNATLTSLRERVAAAFSSIAVLNASFRLDVAAVRSADTSALCIDLEQVREAYALLVGAGEEQLLNTLSRASMQMTELLREVPTDSPENLSVFLIALENPLMLRPQQSFFALERIVNGILALQKTARQQLFGWLKHYPSQFFAQVVQVVQTYLAFALAPQSRGNKIDPAPAVMVLESLYQVNREKRIIPNNLFFSTTLSQSRDLVRERTEHANNRQQGMTQVFNFLDFPFLLSPQVKSHYMRLDFSEHKQAMQVSLFMLLGQQDYLRTRDGHNAIYVPRDTHPLPPGLRITSDGGGTAASASSSLPVGPSSLVLSVKVRRDSLLDDFLDTLRAVASADPRVLALPLLAEFEGEDGVDAGGVTKELMTLAIQALVARTGVIAPTNDNRHVWFTRTDVGLSDVQVEPAVVMMPPHPPAIGEMMAGDNAAVEALRQRVDRVYAEKGLAAPPAGDNRPRTETDQQQPEPAAWRGGLSTFFSFDTDTAALCALYDAEFTLGFLYGFASYNHCLINLPLPPCLYKVMTAIDPSRPLMEAEATSERLRKVLTLEDLTEVEPTLASGLRVLLAWADGDIQDVFGATFTASANPLVADSNGTSSSSAAVQVELAPDGANIAVTRSNREKYVSKVVQHALYDCTAGAAQAFLAGLTIHFKGKTVVEMCTPEDLEELLCGTRDVGDLSLLRLHTTYRGILTDEHPCAQWLWEILSDLAMVQQRRFLQFVTGSDRVPVGGIQNVRLVVQSTGQDPSALPAAHTCFNTLDLPVYPTKEQLRERLLVALEHAEGFGLA